MFLFCFRNHQKTKFQSFVKYFDWIEEQAAIAEAKSKVKCAENDDESGGGGGGDAVTESSATNDDDNTVNTIKISRKVFSGKQWLTIEDWLECNVPLCPLEIKHEGRIERSPENVVQTIFASSRLGGNLLTDGWSQVGGLYAIELNDENALLSSQWIFIGFCCCLSLQECLHFTLFPELFAILLYVESLEDNEVMFIEDLRQFHRIMIDSNKKLHLEQLDEIKKVGTDTHIHRHIKY